MVERAITVRLDELNDTFLQVLDYYIREIQDCDTAKTPQQHEMLTILLNVKQETLRQLSQHLPPQMKAIESAVELKDAADRVRTMREWIRGEHGSPVDPSVLRATIERIVNDFETAAVSLVEDKSTIHVSETPNSGSLEGHRAAQSNGTTEPDVHLLARLCLLREEARLLEEEEKKSISIRSSTYYALVMGGEDNKPVPNDAHLSDQYAALKETSANEPLLIENLSGDAAMSHLKSVPESEASFIKEIMAVAYKPRRVALIEAAMHWDPSLGRMVRPGALLDCIRALKSGIRNSYDIREQHMLLSDLLDDMWQTCIRILHKITLERVPCPSHADDPYLP